MSCKRAFLSWQVVFVLVKNLHVLNAKEKKLHLSILKLNDNTGFLIIINYGKDIPIFLLFCPILSSTSCEKRHGV